MTVEGAAEVAVMTEHRFASGDAELMSYLFRPPEQHDGLLPGVVICHGFPSGAAGGAGATSSAYLTLAERIAKDLGWVVLAVNYRGCGGSKGNFSLAGWLEDTKNSVDELAAMPDVGAVWLAGFGTGGALGLMAAAQDDRIKGVAGIAPPADFADWRKNPKRLLLHSRRIGAIASEDFPESFDEWAAPLDEFNVVEAATALGERPLLLIHGSADELVPVFDSRILADAHAAADLRIVAGASHALRYDPRAVAILLGWLERQRNRTSL